MVEPVARIQSIVPNARGGQISAPNGSYVPGHFYRLGKGQSASNMGPLTQVPLIVIRGDTFAVGATNMALYVNDFIRTGPTCLAAIEFLIGGRVGINSGTIIEIVNERSVADGPISFGRLIAKNVSLWKKADANTLKQPIEIQTNGGVMGIKG